MIKRMLLTSVVLIVGLPAVIFGQEQEAGAGSALMVEAQLCTGIEERMPVGATESFDADVVKVYLWCQVTGAADTTVIKHVWSYEGKEMATVELPVKSAAWRTWSYKTILPEWTGNWEVKVLDAEGDVLKAVSFTVGVVQATEPEEVTQPPDTVKPTDTTETKKP
jgi:hypothetical protein